MARRKLAIIGLGMAVTPHARGLLDLGEAAEVAYAFSPTEARRNAFAERFPFPLATSLDEILGDDSVDAVLILTPPNTHLDLVTQAAAAGKHVLLEKPLEVTDARCAELVDTCRKAGVKLGVMLQHRFRPAGRKLRELIEAGELGPISHVSTGIRLWRPQSYYDEPGRGTQARDGGGVLITQGIHTLDLMLSLAGPVAEVSAYVATTPVHRMETEDLVCAAVRYAGGALGTIEATTAAYPGFPERIDIVGRDATASLVGTELKVHWSDGRNFEIGADDSPGGTGADPMAFPHDYHRELIRDFLAALDEGRDPEVSGEEALKVHRLIAALLESGRTGARVALD